MNNLIVFENENFGNVRVLRREDGEFYFVAKDISEKLGYEKLDSMYRRIDSDDMIKINPQSLDNTGFPHEIGSQIEPNPNVKILTLVNESGLYQAVLGSKLPSAKSFQKWVTKEVLPSIRKHGAYATEDTIDKILNNPDFGIELLKKLKEERIARVEAEKTNAILMHVNKTYTSTEIAKECDLKSAIELNRILSNKKIQFKQNNTWVLYSKYSSCGYTEIKQSVLDNGSVVYDRKWTQLGREFILRLLGKEITE